MHKLWFFFALLTLLVGPSQIHAASKCPTDGVTADEALLHATETLIDAYYNTTTGLFAGTGWWNSASMLYGLAIAARLHTSVNATRVLGLLSNTYELNQAELFNGDFGAEAWWGLCWIAASDLAYHLHQPELGASFLELAMTLGYNTTLFSQYYCASVPPYFAGPNVMTSLLYTSLAGQLALRTGSRQQASARKQLWGSVANFGFPVGAFSNQSSFCMTTFGPHWTCNEGAYLAVVADQDLLQGKFENLLLAAERSAQSISNFSRNGILVENCEPHCNNNGTQYKGIYVRSLLYLWTVLDGWRRTVGFEGHPSMNFVNETLSNIRAFVARNAESVLRRSCEVLPINLPGGRTAEGWFFGQEWSGPFDGDSAGRQSSAFELLLAVVVTSGPE